MPFDTETHAKIAASLYEARQSCAPVPPVTTSHPGFDVDDAYEVQEINTKRLIAEGQQLVGRKIGLTSPSVQAQFGVSEPDFGMLWASGQVAEGDAVPTASLMQPRAEAEIAFVMKAAVTSATPSVDDVAGAIDYAVAAVEIVDSAIADWKITLADTVADNASGAMFQLGTDRHKLSDIDLHLGGMELVRNGKQVSVGVGAACLGNPLNAVQWLAAKMVEVGRPLAAGDIVLSGALGPMAPVEKGDEFITRIQGFAPLHLTFT